MARNATYKMTSGILKLMQNIRTNVYEPYWYECWRRWAVIIAANGGDLSLGMEMEEELPIRETGIQDFFIDKDGSHELTDLNDLKVGGVLIHTDGAFYIKWNETQVVNLSKEPELHDLDLIAALPGIRFGYIDADKIGVD